MTKLSIAIAILAAAASAGSLTRHMNLSNNSHRTPSTIQSDFPMPSCPPTCALPTPTPIPN